MPAQLEWRNLKPVGLGRLMIANSNPASARLKRRSINYNWWQTNDLVAHPANKLHPQREMADGRWPMAFSPVLTGSHNGREGGEVPNSFTSRCWYILSNSWCWCWWHNCCSVSLEGEGDPKSWEEASNMKSAPKFGSQGGIFHLYIGIATVSLTQCRPFNIQLTLKAGIIHWPIFWNPALKWVIFLLPAFPNYEPLGNNRKTNETRPAIITIIIIIIIIITIQSYNSPAVNYLSLLVGLGSDRLHHHHELDHPIINLNSMAMA